MTGFRVSPLTILWKIFRIYQKSTDDLFSRPKIFSDGIPHIYPDRRNAIYSIGGKLFRDGKEKTPILL